MKKSIILALLVLFISLSACGGGGGGGGNSSSPEPEVTNIQAVDLSVSTTEGDAIEFTMNALDTDISVLSCNIENYPSHGTLKQISGATWKYTPNEDFSGIDKLVYTLSKGTIKSNPATVTITVDTVGKIIYVTTSGSTENSGSSWSDALKHPQDAMNKATSGDQIWVAEGTYYAIDSSKPEIPVLALKEGVRIYGGFKGTETYRSERNVSTNVTILDGQENIYHVVKGIQSSRIDGFTIQNGDATVDNTIIIKEEETGGGMLNNNCSDSLIISNCCFLNNNAKGYGGGMTNQGGSSPRIINCRFTDNNAYYGGGIFNSESSAQITNCLFEGNNAYYGGAIRNSHSSPSVINCTISGNNALLGGALYNLSSTATARNCIIWGDTDTEIFKDNYSTIITSYSCIQGGAGGTGNISKNPQFVATGSRDKISKKWIPGDYRLQANSPCIDAADGDSAPALDLNGQARLDILSIANTGTGLITYADMGVYEYAP
ncbi:MAG TPA: Ig-like domain-containing protein [Desulfomonilia bacterium]